MHKNALSLLEIVISIALIAIVILGFSRVFQVGSMSIYKNDQEVTATNLAVGLMSEIISKPFCDPTNCTATLGPETVESRTTCGSNGFDDVDDYNGSVEGPDPAPRDIRACEMAEFKGFIRSVNVSYVYQNMTDSGGATTDFKRIKVSVNSTTLPLISITEVKSNVTQ